ncbi:NUDIX hydrolase [Citricoccus parietis]|uniref:NUDIX hydrolase n=1 Tax=Citricoccus parietis TaxID=592307 RepID=A0ABV6F852_9MICC
MTTYPPLAATVLLLRPGTAPVNPVAPAPEIFTITRSKALAFSAGVSAFPGGRIDEADDLPAPLWSGTDLAAWGRRLGLEPVDAGRLLAGVVRETFEEAGILLARHRDGTPVDAALLDGLPVDTRVRVERHELDFGTLLTDLDLHPEVTCMQPLSRWITPEGAARRYDTYFFAAAIPPGQRPGALSFEGIDSRWTTAAAALEDFREGRHRLMPPTWAQFRTLLTARSVDEALSGSGTLETVRPTFVPGPPSTARDFRGDADYALGLAGARAAAERRRNVQ